MRLPGDTLVVIVLTNLGYLGGGQFPEVNSLGLAPRIAEMMVPSLAAPALRSLSTAEREQFSGTYSYVIGDIPPSVTRQARIFVEDGELVLHDWFGRYRDRSDSRIAFTSRAGIAVAMADGSGVELLVPHHFRDDTYADWDMGVGKPAWSPDGDLIAFEHLGDGDLQPAQIFVAGADGSDPFRPTLSPDGRRYAESDPAWSPDGRSLVFWSFGYGIATVGAAGGQPTTVYKNFPVVAYGAKPVWSPAGTIAFTANANASVVHRGIWIVGAGGDGPYVLIPGAYNPAWSPDGNRMAFVRALALPYGGSP